MKNYCPICDKKMVFPNWCTTCKTYIREPKRLEITYRLNESDTKINTCEFDEHTARGRRMIAADHDYQESYGTAPNIASRDELNGSREAKREEVRRRIEAERRERALRQSTAQPNVPRTTGNAPRGSILRVIFLIYFLFMLFGFVLSVFS